MKIEPCKLCKGFRSAHDISGALQRCLRCAGTGQEPCDISQREIFIQLRAFRCLEVEGWVSMIDVESNVPDVTPNTIIEILRGMLQQLENGVMTMPPAKSH